MGGEYDNNMRGSLFVNDRKTKANQPDYTGNAEVDGVEFFVSGWKKTAKSGLKFLSLSFTKKDDAGRGSRNGDDRRSNRRDDDRGNRNERDDRDNRGRDDRGRNDDRGRDDDRGRGSNGGDDIPF